MRTKCSLPCSQKPTVPVLSQINPVHTLASYFPEINFNIILPSNTQVIQTVSSLQALQPKFHKHFSSHARCMPRPSHPPWFYHLNNIWWRVVHIMKHLIMQFSDLLFLPLSPNIVLRRPIFFLQSMKSIFTSMQTTRAGTVRLCEFQTGDRTI
jgi:hypothetical protein